MNHIQKLPQQQIDETELTAHLRMTVLTLLIHSIHTKINWKSLLFFAMNYFKTFWSPKLQSSSLWWHITMVRCDWCRFVFWFRRGVELWLCGHFNRGKIPNSDQAINMSTIKTPAIHSDKLSISIDMRAHNRFYCGRWIDVVQTQVPRKHINLDFTGYRWFWLVWPRECGRSIVVCVSKHVCSFTTFVQHIRSTKQKSRTARKYFIFIFLKMSYIQRTYNVHKVNEQQQQQQFIGLTFNYR